MRNQNLKGFSMPLSMMLKIVLGLVFASVFVLALTGYLDAGMGQAEDLFGLMDNI